MKKILFIILLTNLANATLKDIEETIHKSKKLRVGEIYYFHNVKNSGSQFEFLNRFEFNFLTNGYNKNNKPIKPYAGWSEDIENNQHQLPPYSSLRFVLTRGLKVTKPNVRLKNNIIIEYILEYQMWINNKWTHRYTLKDIVPYEVTWCGDGIRDNYFDNAIKKNIYEQCDPKDPKKINWGKKGCSKKCKSLN